MDMAAARSKLDASSRQSDSVKLRQRCERRRSAMLSERSVWIPDWMQVTSYVDPARGRFETAATGSRKPKRSRSKIINSTATRCVRVAAAGMSSHMTSKARPWFHLTTHPAIGNLQHVKVWLDEVTDIIRETLAKSNFYKAMPVMYTEDLSYGVAAMLSLPHDDEVVRFHPLTIGSYAISLDASGKVDSLWRSYRKTARQLVEQYGVDDEDGEGEPTRKPDPSRLPEAVARAFKDKPDQEFTVESLFEPNPDAVPGLGDMGMQAPALRPWREVTWLSGAKDDRHGILNIGGHYEAPFVCIRFNPVGDDIYSTAPGVDTLGDIKQLQYLEGQKLKLIDLLAEPPVTVPDSMRNLGASLSPRARNYLPMTQLGAQILPTYTPDPRAIEFIMNEIRVVEARVEDAFFYNLFLLLDSLGDQTGRTAFEIAERKDEKASVLGPTLEIVTDEGLDPTVIRTYRLLERAGRIPPPPEELAGVPLKIEYTSILAQAMKAAGVVGIERTAQFVANLAAADPSVMDNFDADAAVGEYNDRTGGPARIIRSADDVEAIREARAQQQRMQQMAEMAPAMRDGAQAIKTLDESVPQPGSLGEGLAEQMGRPGA